MKVSNILNHDPSSSLNQRKSPLKPLTLVFLLTFINKICTVDSNPQSYYMDGSILLREEINEVKTLISLYE